MRGASTLRNELSGSSPLLWWRIHQLTTAIAYGAVVWPVWHVHRAVGRAGLAWFLFVVAAVAIAAILRVHLWFSSRVYPEDLPVQRGRARWLIGWADVTFVVALIAGGIALPESQAGWAALFISCGVGAGVAFLIIEPATARAAFRKRQALVSPLKELQ